MNENEISIEEKILEIFRKLPLQRQKQILEFAEFLVWQEQKRSTENNEAEKN